MAFRYMASIALIGRVKCRTWSVAALAIGGFLIAAPASAAPTTVPAAPITGLGGGWSENVLRARLDAPFVNPQGCSATDGYITDPTMSGSNLFHSMLMSAYMANKPVSLIVDGCYLDRPRIISVLIGAI